MRTNNRKHGTTLIELMITSVMSLLIGAVLLMLIQSAYTGNNAIQGENVAFAGIRTTTDRLSNNIRNAQLYPKATTGGTVFVADHTTGIVCSGTSMCLYAVNSSGVVTGTDTETYWLDTTSSPYSLKQTIYNGSTATINTILSGVSSLSFTYYLQNGTSFTSTTSTWPTTVNSHVPTSAELSLIGAVKIDAVVSMNSYTREMQTIVRLRNSPYLPR